MGEYDSTPRRSNPDGPSINMDIYLRPGGAGGTMDRRSFCNAPHPRRDDVWCRRWPDHDERDSDGHAAFVHSISEPEFWE